MLAAGIRARPFARNRRDAAIVKRRMYGGHVRTGG